LCKGGGCGGSSSREGDSLGGFITISDVLELESKGLLGVQLTEGAQLCCMQKLNPLQPGYPTWSGPIRCKAFQMFYFTVKIETRASDPIQANFLSKSNDKSIQSGWKSQPSALWSAMPMITAHGQVCH